MKAKAHLKENVKYKLFNDKGELKPLFQVNSLGSLILKISRYLYNPYNEKGELKSGLLSKLSLYGLRIPFLTGQWVTEMNISNLVTTVGKALVAGRLNGSGSPAAADYIAVGTGTTSAVIGDTALETEITDSGMARASATVSLVTTDTANDTAQMTNTFSVTGSKAVTESGVLNAASSGTLLARQTFSAINVASGDTLAMTWKIDVD